MKHSPLPELCKYRESSCGMQMAIHQMLISYVREDYHFNVHMRNNAMSYNLVKLKSINFENEAAAIYVVFETVTGEKMELPIDFISTIEIAGQKEI